MNPEKGTCPLSQIVFDEAIYPRKEHDPALAQRYADTLEQIEAASRFMCVAEDKKLLDGKHRWLGYRIRYEKEPDREVPILKYPVTAAHQQFALAVELNSQHGYQLTVEDKKQCAIKLYGHGFTYETIAEKLSVRKATVSDWLSRTLKEQRDAQDKTILAMWLACETEATIAKALGLTQRTVSNRISGEAESTGLAEKFRRNQSSKLAFQDWISEECLPLYDTWKQQEKSNKVRHFGNSEERWLENLLYFYTQPFDVVVDPFAGGGSTIDVCKRRGRRYYVSDRKPIVEREQEIRKWDVTEGLPPLPRWKDVRLVYLDPPYWKQAEGKYSDDPTDLANMELDGFHDTLARLINSFARKLSDDAVIALLIQSTQWNAPEKRLTPHLAELIRRVKLPIQDWVQCPYESQQCNAQMVDWAKANRRMLVLSRQLMIWRVSCPRKNDSATETPPTPPGTDVSPPDDSSDAPEPNPSP